MGKQLGRKYGDVGMKENNPGCVWGIFHILDYHHWHIVKKIFPHKWHGGSRHARCNENLGEHLIVSGDDKACRDEEEANQFVVEQSSTETNRANKTSLKKEGRMRRVLGLTGRSRFRRTVSIHHLEPSDPRPGAGGTTSANGLPDASIVKASKDLAARNIVDYLRHTWDDAKKHGIFHKKSEKARKASMYQNIMDSDRLNKDVSGHQLKECADVFELLNINKDFFVKILKDPDVSIANRFHSLQSSNSRLQLNKSVSFPTADLARLRNFKPSKLKHKQNESWSLPKREKLLLSAQAPKLGASKSSKDIYVADNFIGSALEQEKRLVKNQEDVNHLEDIKQGAEYASEESSTMESNLLVHGRLSVDENEEETDVRRMGSTIGQDGEDKPRHESATDIPGYEHTNDRGVYTRRTSSLNNSLDRYAQLFEHGFKRVGRWHHSKSLKATNENDFLSGRRRGRTFGRNLSLPEFDFYCAQPNELSSDALSSEQPSRTSLDSTASITPESHNEPKPACLASSTEEFVALVAVLSTEFQNDLVDVESDYQNGPSENADNLNAGKSYEQENILLTDAVASETEDGQKFVQGSDSVQSDECPAGLPAAINDDGRLSEDMDEPIKAENSINQEQGLDFKKNSELVQSSPDSVLENCFQYLTPDSAKSQFSEGSGLKPRCINFDESDALIDSESRSNTDELSNICVKINRGKIKNVKNDEAEFNYVRDVLELSGFTEKEYLEEWHLLDQPMSPSVFEEMEACMPGEAQFSGKEAGPSCDHQLLFDLVNHALVEMCQRSFTYCPRVLSYSCRVYPMPAGHHVVAAVWASICARLSSGREKEPTLNDVVAGDLAKDDGWMNLQSETEYLALDVEDMIFHELLDEMLCC